MEVILNQGIKRQIRRQLSQLGYKIKRLVRIRFGPVSLFHLPVRGFRPLNSKEIRALSAV